MTSQKQLLFAYGIAIHLLIIGIVCYAAFSTKNPEKPIRLMYKTTAGKVLFDHEAHYNKSKYGNVCYDCHHHPSEDVSAISSCNDCHKSQPDNITSTNLCLNCHELEDIESTENISREKAFHNQCIQCHENIESGPQKCAQCHVL